MRLARWRTIVVLLWLGLVVCLALMAAPMAFAMLPRPDAGRLAGALFRLEAHLALGLSLLLFLIERTLASRRFEAGQGSRMSAELLLVLGALFCTVLGYFALQPMMEAARAGQGHVSFGMLHGVSSGLFALKGLLLAVLGWRATAPVTLPVLA